MFFLDPATFGGPDVAEKYDVHQNAPFKEKQNLKKCFPRRASGECGSRRFS